MRKCGLASGSCIQGFALFNRVIKNKSTIDGYSLPVLKIIFLINQRSKLIISDYL